MRNSIAVTLFIAGVLCRSDGVAQENLDQLSLKGTHNSYAAENGGLFGCGWNSCPVMRDSPWAQVDDFGVWALELDVGFENGRLVIGHDGPGCWAPEGEWGYYVEDYLLELKNTQSWDYRPIIVYFEYKQWSGQGLVWINDLESAIRSLFAEHEVFGPKDWTGSWPTVPELKRKLIALALNPDETSEWIFPQSRLSRTGPPITDHYTCLNYLREELLGTATVVATDEYELDWTYEVVAPPNPICLDPSAPSIYTITTSLASTKYCDDEDNCMIYGGGTQSCSGESNGDACVQPNVYFCGCTDPTNYDEPYVVHPQGTFSTPYRSFAQAAGMARPGWTLLLKPGHYPGPVTIAIPLTIALESGPVVIGE